MHASWLEDPCEDFPGGVHFSAAAVPGSKALIPIGAIAELVKMPPRKPSKPILRNLAMEETSLNGSAMFGSCDFDSPEDIPPFRRGLRTVEGTYPEVSAALKVPGAVCQGHA